MAVSVSGSCTSDLGAFGVHGGSGLALQVGVVKIEDLAIFVLFGWA